MIENAPFFKFNPEIQLIVGFRTNCISLFLNTELQICAIVTYEIMMSNLTSRYSHISSTAAPFIVPDMHKDSYRLC